MKHLFILNIFIILILLPQCLGKKRTKHSSKKSLLPKKTPPYFDPHTGEMTVYVDKKYHKQINTIFYHLTTRTCLKYRIQNTPIKSKSGINFYKTSKYNKVKLSYKKNKPTIVKLKSSIFKNKTKLAFYVGLALGMIPEISRHDRDDYVEVKWGNIKNSYKKFYKKKDIDIIYPNLTYDEFDFGSVMLVDSSFGSKNKKKPTYKHKVYKKYNKIHDKYNIFSHNNFKTIYEMYCPKKCINEDDCENGSFHGKNCDFCVCPPHFYGKKCQHFMYNIGKCGRKKNFISDKYLNHIIYKNLKGKCAYSITSKAKKAIIIQIHDIKFSSSKCTADDSYVDILYRQDKGTTGLTICKNVSDVLLTPLSNEVYVYVHAPKGNNFIRIDYRDNEFGLVIKEQI